jgi:hypothetical protein
MFTVGVYFLCSHHLPFPAFNSLYQPISIRIHQTQPKSSIQDSNNGYQNRNNSNHVPQAPHFTTNNLTQTPHNTQPSFNRLVEHKPPPCRTNSHMPQLPPLRHAPPKGALKPRHPRRPLHPQNLARSPLPHSRQPPGSVHPSPQRTATIPEVDGEDSERAWEYDAVYPRGEVGLGWLERRG